MEAGSPQPTISERARRCLVSFQECLAGMITLGPIRKSLIENEFARFSIWTSNVGVFASGRASIDYHLRKEPSIQRLVLGLLEVLHGRIEQYLNALKIINNPLPLQSKEQAVAAHGDLQRAVESMAREIALLHDLTRTIRRASKKANDVEEAISFRIEDEKGNNVEERLANYFAANIRHQFPRLSNIIRLRLAEAMVIRRRRIIYKRLRYPKDPTKTIQPTIQPIIQQPNSIQTEDTVIISQHAGRPEVMTHLKPMGLFISKSLDKIVTPVAPKSFQKAATPPVVSQLQAMSLRSHEDYAFPSPPKHVPAATEVLCPFCLIMLPIQEVQNEERWRDHVMADLYPYVCLTDNCDRPDEIYRHSEEWLRHTRKHSLRWRCASRAHNSMLFDTKDEYIGHLKSKHRRTVSDNQIAALANRSLQLTGPLFKSCPFCGIEEQSGRGRLQEHIIDHLQSLALKSLPPIDDENEQTNNLNRSQEEDFNTSFRKQIIPQTDTPDITTFLSATSVSVPEARLAIKSRYYTTEMITTGTDIILSGKTPSQGGIIYVSQLPEDVDYTIKIELEEPLPHSVVKIIECQIVYDPGSDNCVFINWTRSILSLSNLRQLNSSKILEVNRMCIIQPGAWGIKLHGVDDATDSGLVFQIWLRERRHAIAIAQENSPLQNQAIEDSHRSAKRQRINASPAVDIIPQGSNSTTDWDIEAKDNIMTVDSDIFDLQDGGLAMIHTPISTPIFQTHHFPAGYQIKRIGKISEKGTTSILRCDHSLIAGGLAMKVLQYKHKSPSSLVQLSELWKQEKSTLKKLDHRNIVALKGFDGRMLALFLELLPLSLDRGRDSQFISSDAFKILDDISSALTYLKAQNVVHNDIKPSNIAYSPDRGAVLFDFQIASSSDESKSGGSPWYMPPEFIVNQKRHFKGDIWAFGITMLYILKKIQYPENMADGWNMHEIRNTSSNAKRQMANWLKLIGNVREELDRANTIESIVFRMLEKDPGSRITTARIQQSLKNHK